MSTRSRVQAPLGTHFINDIINKIFYILIYIFIIRYIFLFLYAYINVHDGITFINGERIFSTKFLIVISLKALFDFFLISFITAILYLKTKFYIHDKISND